MTARRANPVVRRRVEVVPTVLDGDEPRLVWTERDDGTIAAYDWRDAGDKPVPLRYSRPPVTGAYRDGGRW